MSNPLEFHEDIPAAMNIATISAGFEKGDFLVREEQGNRVYFDFFEEDYQMAQAAVGESTTTTTPNHLYSNTSNNNDVYNVPSSRQNEEMSYFESYIASMGRPYSDLTNEKLGR